MSTLLTVPIEVPRTQFRRCEICGEIEWYSAEDLLTDCEREIEDSIADALRDI